jgi:hypothetical protein
LTITSADINGGTVDGTVIGGSTPAAITGTTITANTGFSGSINGTVGGTTPAAGTFTSLTDSGNLTFTGTGNRITGDFSNATVANRVMFQNSVTNGSSYIHALPNGTATQSGLIGFNNSDSSNAAFAQIGATSTDVRVVSSITGTTSYLPMTFYTGGSERMRVDTSGNVGIGTTSPNKSSSSRALTVNAASGYSALELASGDTSRWYINSDGSSTFDVTVGNQPRITFVNGAERMRIDSSGNVGIGTSSPGARLGVAGDMRILANAGTTTHTFGYNENGGEIILCDETGAGSTLLDQAGNSTRLLELVNGSELQVGLGSANTTGVVKFMRAGYVEAARIDSSGNVGIGTTSPGVKLDVYTSGTASNFIRTRNDTTQAFFEAGNGYAFLNASTNHPLIFGTNNTERARIDASGNLLVGTTTQRGAAKFGMDINPSANAGIVIYPTTNVGYDAARFQNNSSSQIGAITCTTTGTAYNTSSDYRLKEDIAPMTGALAKVQALKPVTYKWKADGSDGEGFIAHELAEVVPQCVTGEKDAVDSEGKPVYQGIDTSFLVATLTAAIQEQQQMIEELKAKVAALENA